MYDQRNFMIFNCSELEKIDWNQVLESGPDTVRKSVDKNKTFVKWDGENVPSSVDNLVTKIGPYSYEEMLQLLSGPEWTGPNPSVL